MNLTNSFQASNAYKTRIEIAAEYGISTKTLLKKLKAEGLDMPTGRVSLYWQKKIYEALCYPPSILKRDYRDI